MWMFRSDTGETSVGSYECERVIIIVSAHFIAVQNFDFNSLIFKYTKEN